MQLKKVNNNSVRIWYGCCFGKYLYGQWPPIGGLYEKCTWVSSESNQTYLVQRTCLSKKHTHITTVSSWQHYSRIVRKCCNRADTPSVSHHPWDSAFVSSFIGQVSHHPWDSQNTIHGTNVPPFMGYPAVPGSKIKIRPSKKFCTKTVRHRQCGSIATLSVLDCFTKFFGKRNFHSTSRNGWISHGLAGHLLHDWCFQPMPRMVKHLSDG